MHGDYKEALNEFRKAYSILNIKNIEEKKKYTYIYASYARIAYTNNEFSEALKIAKEALTIKKEYIDLYYLLGISEKQLGNNEDSIRYFKKYIDLVKRYNELEISNNISIIMYQIDDNCKSMAYFEIVKYYLDSEKYKEAYEIYNNIINVKEKIYSAINILIPLKLYPELRKVYNSFTLAKDKNSFLCTLEEKIKELEDSQKINLYREFSLNEDLYGLFNKARITSNTNDKIRLTEFFLKEIDFSKEPVFYSGIFENLKESIKLIIDVFKGIEVWNLKGIVKYLSEEKGFIEIFENYILKDNKTFKNIEEAKVFISIANVLLLLYIKDNDKVSNKYSNIFKAYLNIGMVFAQELYRLDRAKFIYKNINDQEDRFFIIMYIINNLVKENDKKSALKYMIEAVNTYEPIAKYIYVYKDEIINLEEEKNKEFEDYKLKVKENINDLVNSSLIEEAKGLIGEYEGIVKNDLEIYSIKAVIAIMENKFQEAELILKEGLNIDENNFDLNYNLAYLYEQEDKYNDALNYYKITLENCKDENVKSDIINIVEKISSEHNILIVEDKKKIAFFVKQGMDSFIGDIINGLSDEYETRKIIVTDYKQIDEGMHWADICWFEWCDELVAYGSKLTIACEKKIICRLHSYEAFTNYPNNVNWDDVDNVIFVAEHIRNFVVEKFKINKNRTTIIPNGIDIQRYSFKERKTGFNIAYVGHINYKKGPMLLLHTFKAIYDKDSRYKLYIAGQFQDDRDSLYFKQMIKEFGIEKNVFYEGWQDNLNQWLDDKNYILCTSILESQNMSVMQAMAKGIKPIVHNFVGAKAIYNNDYVWNTINEAVSILQDKNYNSKEYFQFLKDNYSIEKELNSLNELLILNKNNSKDNFKNKPLVTVGITNYNGKQYLEKCIESFLNQTYSNIEIY
jgi:glycosyltransferase involved in cell wall biosynthesis